MKKKLLFTAYSLGLGGIETALVNLLNRLDYDKYEVTLILEKKEGIFLDEIPSNVKVLEYKISDSKIVPLRKIYNRSKLIKWSNKLNKKYDFSCSFATYSRPGALLALAASDNNAIWVHNNYYITYEKNVDNMKAFFDGVRASKFKHVVFVSDENRRDVCNHYKELEPLSYVCNNFINGDLILEKAEEPCEYERKDVPTFVNVGRHDENQKRLSRIIDASSKLASDGYKFDVVFVGEGEDTGFYKDMVEKKDLKDYIHFVGKKKNPYPYYKISDAVILSSDYEGYPVVFLETMILDKPILSTKVSDYEELDGIHGIFVDKDTDSIYMMMKNFIYKGFKIKDHFDYKEYNKNIKKKINNLINE